MTTRVFIIPALHKDAGNAMSAAMGWGQPVFVQPLSATGQEPITHWGFPTIVGGELIAIWDNPPPEAESLVAVTITDDREGNDTAGHWYDALTKQGLKQILTQELDSLQD